MKSFEQIAQSMYHAYSKHHHGGKELDEHGLLVDMSTWDELGELTRECWVEAAKQAAAELALFQG